MYILYYRKDVINMEDTIKGLLLTILAGACAGASVGIGYVAGCKAGEALADRLIEIRNTSKKKKRIK
jgi:predicted acylesterase/phospholipase RssA